MHPWLVFSLVMLVVALVGLLVNTIGVVYQSLFDWRDIYRFLGVHPWLLKVLPLYVAFQPSPYKLQTHLSTSGRGLHLVSIQCATLHLKPIG